MGTDDGPQEQKEFEKFIIKLRFRFPEHIYCEPFRSEFQVK